MKSDPWEEFWANQGPAGGGCMPDRWEPLDRALAQAWARFAESLPKRARVLDLATGDGRVPAYLHTRRSDLDLIGVDRAQSLPKAGNGYRLRAGVAMEQLPFRDKTFAAITSQFGFEYGDIERTAGEIGRVLKSGGHLGLLTHSHDGAILAHNRARAEAIRWVMRDADLFGKAHAGLKLRALNGPPVPPLLAQAPARGAELFGPNSAAWEIAEAIRRSLLLGTRDRPENVATLLRQIEARAGNELGRIASLEKACAVTADAERIDGALHTAGMCRISIVAVGGPDGRPIGDFRHYVAA